MRGLGEKAVLAWEEEDAERLQPGVEQLNRVEAVRGAIAQLGEGCCVLSWIWYSVSMGEDGDFRMHEGTVFKGFGKRSTDEFVKLFV